MSSDKRVSGTIRIRWSISERDLGVDGIERELTSEELRAFYDHIEDALTRALHRTVYVQKPPVCVVFEVMGDDEIELDTGPLRTLRARVAELERDARLGEEREQSDEALLRQALEALERFAWDTLSGRNAAYAIRERLGLEE